MNDQIVTDERAADGVARALRALPSLAPPRRVTRRIDTIVARAASDRSGRRRAPRRARFAMAASLLAAVSVVALLHDAGTRTAPADAPAPEARIEALMAQSAYLEDVLAAVPRGGRVRRVGTASTITALEDRVALIDARLSEPAIAADADGRAVLWRERVGLMNTLVALQAQPAASVML